MATLNTSQPPQPRTDLNRQIEPFELPILLEQLQDDLDRSRKREAFWISLFVHAIVILGIFTSPTWMSWLPAKTITVSTPEQLIQEQKELTYLALPPDEQKLTQRPNTDTISNKDRVATSRSPQVNRKELQKILDSGRPGAPGPAAPPGAPSPRPQPQTMAQGQQPGPRGQQNQATQPAASSQAPSFTLPTQSARVQQPPSPFANAGAVAPGSAIAQAARAAATNRAGGYGGGGDYGISTGGAGKVRSDMDILSDTMGVNFGPYLERVLHDVRMNWYNLVPEAARPPLLKKGRVSVEFAITKQGEVAGIHIVTQSGDVSLDRAALGGITGSNPFPPLPSEFRGSYLALRIHFYYNPDRNELR